jgi:hypothetical protein
MKPYPSSAEEILDTTFLEIRAKILEIAAAFDRIERADVSQTVETQPKWQQLQGAVRIVQEGAGNRAEQIQLHFSDPYDAHWEQPKPAGVN